MSTASLVMLAVAAAGYADMVPCRPDVGNGQLPQAGITSDSQNINFTNPFSSAGITDLSSLSVEVLPKASADAGPTGQSQALQVFAKEPRSLDLCLYALLGLGLCKSASSVKKLSFGHIPEWYHTAGPYQIGHTFAISPDCLTSAPVICFIQPDGEVENVTPQYSSGVIAVLLRKSQFTPTSLASRGPPSLTHESLIAE